MTGSGDVPVGGLRWGLKESFLRYVARMPDGRCSVSDGADVVGDREFRFEPDGKDVVPGSGAVLHRFRGDVRFSGHHGFLFVRIADPWLEVSGTSGVLSIPTVVDGVSADGPPAGRLPLVTFALADTGDGAPVGVIRGVRVQLTDEGSDLFNEVYPSGEPFEDLTFPLTSPAMTASVPTRGDATR
jgi:hypothetical protein